MKKKAINFPWHYILFTFYPLLYLWAANISQMNPGAVIRPFLFTLIGSGVLFFFLVLIFRDFIKAGLAGSLLLFAFFTYGHVYYATRAEQALAAFNHHSVLLPLYLVVIGLGTWGILRLKAGGQITRSMNWISLALVVLQIGELAYAYINTSLARKQPVSIQSEFSVGSNLNELPDIYVIVLDAYMRQDALEQDLGYDNSAFINELTQLGFYVPDCSQPNYSFTYASISALLNMRYIPDAYANDIWSQFTDGGFWSILENNEVQAQLKNIGYKTVAFQEEYPLLEFEGSDVFIGTNHPTINSAYLYPFEVLYKQSTAAILLNALDPTGKISSLFSRNDTDQSGGGMDLSGLTGANKDLVATHIISTAFILDHIPDVPAIAGPKFTYVHLFIPHYPYVFSPDGQIMTDPGYYSGDRGSAVNSTYEVDGYVKQVQYINARMIPILQNILTESKKPPIILLMGDHGLFDSNRQTNLMAFYLPENGETNLYQTITPVNAFRIIFNQYFGAQYPLLPDLTYITDTITESDPYPNCAP